MTMYGDWVTGDPTKPIEWKFKGDPCKEGEQTGSKGPWCMA